MWDPRAEGHIVTHVYVALERDKDGYPPFDTEEIDASSLGGARYRIEGIPVFVSGLAKGDIVKVVVTRGDGRRWVTEVLEPSGHLTARVMPWQADALGEVAARFKSLDCPAHATPYGLVAVDVPPSASTERVMRALEKGRATGEWDFDMGVAPGAY
jgi:hypothetical protein